MAKSVDVCYAYLDLGDPRPVSPMSLRGYIGYLFIEDTEFHHHSESPYHYPLVQYKRVNKRLLVMGLGEYADMVYRKMPEISRIVTPQGQISIVSLELVKNTVKVGLHTSNEKESCNRYRFVTPWIALNEVNYAKFIENKQGRKELLQRILVGNILSMLKGFSIQLDFQIKLNIEQHATLKTSAHNNPFVGFRTVFDVNLLLPEYIGLGKSVSKGFGAVEAL
jgi:hypothetical protein